MLGHVLLDLIIDFRVSICFNLISMYNIYLEIQIVDEGLVLSVYHAVGDCKTEETSSNEGETQQKEDLSLAVL